MDVVRLIDYDHRPGQEGAILVLLRKEPRTLKLSSRSSKIIFDIHDQSVRNGPAGAIAVR